MKFKKLPQQKKYIDRVLPSGIRYVIQPETRSWAGWDENECLWSYRDPDGFCGEADERKHNSGSDPLGWSAAAFFNYAKKLFR